MKLVFEKEALEEYLDAARYSQRTFGLGSEFIKAVQNAIDALSADPIRFQQIGAGVYVFRMKRFPFCLFYHHSTEEKSIIIYAVAHHARRPDYWRKRLKPLK
jgi:toxin ParE1/3/4